MESPDEQGQLDEAEDAASTRDATFVSWIDLERVADEAADIDSIVRTELERVGHPRPLDERLASDERGKKRAARPRRGVASLLLPIVFLVAVAGLAVVAARSRSLGPSGAAERSPTTSAVLPATGEPSPTTSAVLPATGEPSPAAGAVPPATQVSSPEPTASDVVAPILARLSITDRCWVQAIVDGETVFTGTLTTGARTFRADRSLSLTLGNAGGAQVEVNGRAVPTGDIGEVVDLSFVLRGTRLVQLPS